MQATNIFGCGKVKWSWGKKGLDEPAPNSRCMPGCQDFTVLQIKRGTEHARAISKTGTYTSIVQTKRTQSSPPTSFPWLRCHGEAWLLTKDATRKTWPLLNHLWSLQLLTGLDKTRICRFVGKSLLVELPSSFFALNLRWFVVSHGWALGNDPAALLNWPFSKTYICN